MSSENTKSQRLFYLVPAFMSFIFVLHLGLTHLGDLSPWKGGGFGMFSTVDNPWMRVIHCQGIDTNGDTLQVRVKFSGLGEKGPLTRQLGKLLITFPRTGQLKEVGEELLKGEFVPYETPKKVPGEFTHLFDEQTFYRMKYPYEKDVEAVRLQQVIISMLKIRYSTNDNGLRYEVLIPPIHLYQPSTNDKYSQSSIPTPQR